MCASFHIGVNCFCDSVLLIWREGLAFFCQLKGGLEIARMHGQTRVLLSSTFLKTHKQERGTKGI